MRRRPHAPYTLGGTNQIVDATTLQFVDLYIDECRRLGREPGLYWRPMLPMSIHLCEDPRPGLGRN